MILRLASLAVLIILCRIDELQGAEVAFVRSIEIPQNAGRVKIVGINL